VCGIPARRHHFRRTLSRKDATERLWKADRLTKGEAACPIARRGAQRRLLKLPRGIGLHSLRHTCLTEKGKTVDAFTLMKIAGHSAVTMTQKYVHPQKDAIRAAFSAKIGAGSPRKVPRLRNAGEGGS